MNIWFVFKKHAGKYGNPTQEQEFQATFIDCECLLMKYLGICAQIFKEWGYRVSMEHGKSWQNYDMYDTLVQFWSPLTELYWTAIDFVLPDKGG